MSSLTVSEFVGLGGDSHGGAAPAVKLPPLAQQALSIGSTISGASQAFGAPTRFVRFFAEVACRVAVGPAPDATSILMPLAVGGSEYFEVAPGDKFAVIGGSS